MSHVKLWCDTGDDMLVFRTMFHFSSLHDPCACFFRQLCMGHPCPRHATHQTSSVASHCRPCSSATSRPLTLRWVLDLPSFLTNDDRNVSARRYVKQGHFPRKLLAGHFTQRTVPWRRRARGCIGRVFRRLRSLRC